MHEITVESLMGDYRFSLHCIDRLDDNHFLYCTRQEREAMRGKLAEEARQDQAFKLLALLDAALRNDFHQSRASRRRDPISMLHRQLHTEYRNERPGNLRSRDVSRRIPVGAHPAGARKLWFAAQQCGEAGLPHRQELPAVPALVSAPAFAAGAHAAGAGPGGFGGPAAVVGGGGVRARGGVGLRECGFVMRFARGCILRRKRPSFTAVCRHFPL